MNAAINCNLREAKHAIFERSALVVICEVQQTLIWYTSWSLHRVTLFRFTTSEIVISVVLSAQ
jgi:hypothetical protein